MLCPESSAVRRLVGPLLALPILAGALSVAVPEPLVAQHRELPALAAAPVAPALFATRSDSIPVAPGRGVGRRVWLAAAMTAGVVALVPLDLEIAEAVRSVGTESGVVRTAGDVFRLTGAPGSFLVVGGLYGAGYLTDRPHLAAMGVDAAQAVATAGFVTYSTKALVGRARPVVSASDPYDFGFGRGFSEGEFRSLPSGHTTAAFAVASVLSTRLGQRHPDTRRWVVPLLYTTASLAGLSRMYHEEHWASDVAAGAAIGTISGWITTDLLGRR